MVCVLALCLLAATVDVPEAHRDHGAIQWRLESLQALPAGTDALPLVRMGGWVLAYRAGRVAWCEAGIETAAYGAWWKAVRASQGTPYPVGLLRLERGGLLEMSWGVDEPRVYFNGCVINRSRKPLPGAAHIEVLHDALGQPRFIDVADIGLTHAGVLYAQDFEAGKLPPYWYGSDKGGRGETAVFDGAAGSAHALGLADAGYRRGLLWNTAGFTVTADTRFCFLVRSDHDRVGVNVATPQNHFHTVSVTPNRWTAVQLEAGAFKLKPGDEAVQFSFSNRGKKRMTIAVDNFAVIRGKDEISPTAPASISVEGDRITWTAATDNAGVARYRVYRFNVEPDQPNDDALIAQTLDTTHTDRLVTNYGTWWYAVAAEDYSGNVGPLAIAPPVEITEQE